MTTADWALVISIISAGVSLAGFIWNIWSKFIYPKPKVRVGFSMMIRFDADTPTEQMPEALCLTATNMGPAEVTLTKAVVRFRSSPFKTKKFGILNVLPRFPQTPGEIPAGFGPLAGGLPKKLQVGEEFSVYLLPDHERLAKGDYHHIGFADTFGRSHWARRRDIIATLPRIREACAKANKNWRHAA